MPPKKPVPTIKPSRIVVAPNRMAREINPKRSRKIDHSFCRQFDLQSDLNRIAHNKWVLDETTIFNEKSFDSLPLLGKGGEGVVRLFTIPEGVPLLKNEANWAIKQEHFSELAVKRFNSGARSSPKNQELALHSLSFVLQYLRDRRGFKVPFDIRISRPLAIQGPFMVMRYFGPKTYSTIDHLPLPLRKEIFHSVMQLSNEIKQLYLNNDFQKLLTERGLSRASADFVPGNFFYRETGPTKVYPNGGRFLIIVDQFEESVRSTDRRYIRHSHERLRKKWRPLIE